MKTRFNKQEGRMKANQQESTGAAPAGDGSVSSVDIDSLLANGPVVFFDGVCNICNHSVNTLLKLDRKGKLRYASLQGAIAEQVFGPLEKEPDSMKLSVPRSQGSGRNLIIYEGYQAFLRVGSILYPLLKPLALVLSWPPFSWMGRGLYAFIAAHRYRWFGKRDFCDISNLKFKERFLD
tara:strand:- start:15409 stop:15945 length:537 start_codon:yes stop_codon:yes gene_type:complete